MAIVLRTSNVLSCRGRIVSGGSRSDSNRFLITSMLRRDRVRGVRVNDGLSSPHAWVTTDVLYGCWPEIKRGAELNVNNHHKSQGNDSVSSVSLYFCITANIIVVVWHFFACSVPPIVFHERSQPYNYLLVYLKIILGYTKLICRHILSMISFTTTLNLV